jgi:hypothetical protein
MCRGCDNLIPDVIQLNFWDESGRKKLKEPTKTKKPYCREYHLHTEYLDRIVDGENICLFYHNDGIS